MGGGWGGGGGRWGGGERGGGGPGGGGVQLTLDRNRLTPNEGHAPPEGGREGGGGRKEGGNNDRGGEGEGGGGGGGGGKALKFQRIPYRPCPSSRYTIQTHKNRSGLSDRCGCLETIQQRPRRGKSGLHRAQRWVTPTVREDRESATERIPPAPRVG